MSRKIMNEAMLIADLNNIGIKLSFIWNVTNIHIDDYENYANILIKHIEMNYDDSIKDGIARALAKKRARKLAWSTLFTMYLNEPNKINNRLKQGLAVALSEMATDKDILCLINLLENDANGPTRGLFIRRIARSNNSYAKEVILRNRFSKDIQAEIERQIKIRRWSIASVDPSKL